jgi:hypothetical protein
MADDDAWLSSRFPTATLWFLGKGRFDRLIKWIGDWGSLESLCRPVAFGGGAKRPRKLTGDRSNLSVLFMCKPDFCQTAPLRRKGVLQKRQSGTKTVLFRAK